MKNFFKIASPLLCLAFFLSIFSNRNKGALSLKKVRRPASVHGRISNLKTRFIDDVNKFSKDEFDLNLALESFNSEKALGLTAEDDWIDKFIESLPKNYRRHYTFVHRSYSIQKGTPTSPRVILFGPRAKTMMTFNGGTDLDSKKMQGGDNIEVIKWNPDKKVWDFSELGFKDSKIEELKNPAKCVMCHSGTPKAIKIEHASAYLDQLKPIFPQYPLWPGFYGGLNDIVGIEGTSDGVGVNWPETIGHVNEFTFGDHEELFRLRKLLDENPLYQEVVRNEISVHKTHFKSFSDSMKERKRYKHLVSLKELYTDVGESVPEFLKSAPYRRNFHREYGHYILRPNFYLTSIMTFYHAENVAKEILNFPEFDKFKYSLLASKYNCDKNSSVNVSGLTYKDLEQTFELVYPNIRNQETMDRQYLLAYQYNLVNEANGGLAHLPLHAWNLEGNEDIASYHYGNVFADLNELVLWDLARAVFPSEITNRDDREGAEQRHYLFNGSDYFKNYLNEAGGQRSGFSSSQQKFVEKTQNYYGYSSPKLKGLPVSKHCSLFLERSRSELVELAKLKTEGKLPHQVYVLDEDLINLPKWDESVPVAINAVRQGCESCHNDPEERIPPRMNTDWMSPDYHRELFKEYSGAGSVGSTGKRQELMDYLESVLSEEALPVPFGNSMPYGRRKMDPFSAQCELMISRNNYRYLSENPNAGEALMFKAFECDLENDPDSINCRCRSLYIRKNNLYKRFYEGQNSEQ